MNRSSRYSLFAYLLLLSGCADPKTEFEQSLEKIDRIELPVTFNSKQGFDLKGITIDSIGVGSVPYGRAFETDSFFAVIHLHVPVGDPEPLILTLDKNGKVIDQFDVFKTTGPDAGFFSTEDVTILPDKSIVSIDSTETWAYDSTIGDFGKVGTLTVTKEKYVITNAGKIKKVE